jgi:hypothetical protein
MDDNASIIDCALPDIETNWESVWIDLGGEG